MSPTATTVIVVTVEVAVVVGAAVGGAVVVLRCAGGWTVAGAQAAVTATATNNPRLPERDVTLIR